MATLNPDPSGVTADAWAFAAPDLALVREDAPQRVHDLWEVFTARRWVVKTGRPWAAVSPGPAAGTPRG